MSILGLFLPYLSQVMMLKFPSFLCRPGFAGKRLYFYLCFQLLVVR